ncbi:hypothetical protein XO10_03755 [Marinitoga sp. 1135]|uniref:Periplasmic component of the Tol biopolymer transport system n=1 Tax=Marinitoga piezophila (strain DSM 14283 / JCM 11233 / KA3) TaxID=443254 RepID=H2J6J4_MARPK|nr:MULTISPECIES: PD40 domain-containing protein [Marinitoga]AEX85179.1 periplasmic component of the Tol biopolymer transport system [Marinitoga piezophila KA3]APT75672.1 hypothetical protein LN42_04185 [Marinitoga sp. 1137]NUU95413.1 hypothetical protein [Marinitoga sp. 1135]NUU97340.1 hypothetical protein [Marinitoga sp. 1138]
MKKFLLIVFFSLVVLGFSQISFKKEIAILESNSDSWIASRVFDLLKDKLSYTYRVYTKSIEKDTNNMTLDNVALKIGISDDASQNIIRIVANFEDEEIDLSERIKDNDKWLNNFVVRVLEKISFARYKKDKRWHILQLTYWDGIDEYPKMSKDGNKLIFISDRYIGNRNIWGYDFEKEKYFNVSLDFSSEYFPNITEDGTFIFQTSLYGKWDVVMYNPDTEEIKRISNESFNAYSPYYENGNVYFSIEELNGKIWTEIYKYSIKSNELEKITNLEGTTKYIPGILNNKLIFQMEDPKSGQFGIYEKRKEGIYPLIDTDLNEVDPFGNKDNLVFSRLYKGYYTIILYNNKTKKEIPITLGISDDAFYPSIYNDIVLFSLYYKNGEPDIFAVRIK